MMMWRVETEDGGPGKFSPRKWHSGKDLKKAK